MVGYSFMGRAHSHAWRSVGAFYDVPPVRQQVLVGRDEQSVKEVAPRYGWAEAATDWRTVVERDDVDIVDICTPGNSHAEIAIAALEAGKHVLCEKPLANTVAEAEAMAEAAARAAARGVRSMVGFTYRRVPAVAMARAAASAMASASATVLASGFSHSTCLPASSAATAISACVSPGEQTSTCLLYTSPSPRDLSTSRMPSSA